MRINLKKDLKVSSKIPVPTESSTEVEKLQYELAECHAAYKARGKQIEELEAVVLKFQEAFGAIDREMQGVLR